MWTQRMLAALGHGVKGGKGDSLWDTVWARATREAAWQAVQRNHGAAGVEGVRVERFAAQAERDLGELEAQRKAGSSRPQGVRRAYLGKSDGGGRPLGVPTVIA